MILDSTCNTRFQSLYLIYQPDTQAISQIKRTNEY